MILYLLIIVNIILVAQIALFYKWKKSNDEAIAQAAEVRDRINSLYVYVEDLYKRTQNPLAEN